jgi:hypothetical protein
MKQKWKLVGRVFWRADRWGVDLAGMPILLPGACNAAVLAGVQKPSQN